MVSGSPSDSSVQLAFLPALSQTLQQPYYKRPPLLLASISEASTRISQTQAFPHAQPCTRLHPSSLAFGRTRHTISPTSSPRTSTPSSLNSNHFSLPPHAHMSSNSHLPFLLHEHLHQTVIQVGNFINTRIQMGLLHTLANIPLHDHTPRWLRHLHLPHLHFPHLHLHLPWRRVHREQRMRRKEEQEAMQHAREWYEKGVQYERAMQMAKAARCFEEAVNLDPENLEYLVLWSKQISDRTYEQGVTKDQVKQINSEAAEVAERAVQLHPTASYAHVARCVSRGRLALVSDNRTLVMLAKLAQEDARLAMELDPNNDLAHHLLGRLHPHLTSTTHCLHPALTLPYPLTRWHWEMAQQNFVVRALVKVLFGTDLPPGTFPEALECYRKAVELRPGRLIHRIELARTHAKLGNKEEAIEALKTALELDVEDVNAHLQLQDGKLLLQRLEGNRGFPW